MTPQATQTLALQIATNAVLCAASRIHGRSRLTLQDASVVEMITGLLNSMPGFTTEDDDADTSDLDHGQSGTIPDAHVAVAQALGRLSGNGADRDRPDETP